VFVFGIDEHTGIVMDLDADTAEIVGKGAVTLRGGGASVRIESGQTIPLDTLRAGPQLTGQRRSSLRRRSTGVRPRSDPWPR
jgi:hypothetical protein